MKLTVYTKTKDSETFYTKFLPDELSWYLDLDCCNNEEYLGNMCCRYIVRNTGRENVYWSDNWNMRLGRLNYIVVNDKDKFVIKNRTDVLNFFKYLTDEDLNKFIKQFQVLDKIQDAQRDFTGE